MTEQPITFVSKTDALYDEMFDWHVNVGDEHVVAKRIPGKHRRLKWFAMSVWLIYFLVPYLRWQGEQAVLLDIPNRQFNFFAVNLFPQDIWMLSLTLLFFAILLAAVTSIAGRIFCGYFCFQTVWTDVYTKIETWLEGDTPHKQAKFRQSAWTLNKLNRRILKHTLWILIALLTGVTFSAWFTDSYQLWGNLFSLQVHVAVWIVLLIFTGFTYIFAGFMREQVCFWLCPYARLQGVMYDQNTVLPAYDAERGEPRGKIKRDTPDPDTGSCIECHLCVAVCPTGIDIRKGQQEGCITCGLCIDACDSVMDKINEPRGLIRYASHAELYQKAKRTELFKRPRVLLYGLILLLSLAGIVYGFGSLSLTELSVTPARQPQFVKLSNGDIQNRYTLKLLNKSNQPITVSYYIAGLEAASLHGLQPKYVISPGKVVPVMALVRVPAEDAPEGVSSIKFIANVIDNPSLTTAYQSIFTAPIDN